MIKRNTLVLFCLLSIVFVYNRPADARKKQGFLEEYNKSVIAITRKSLPMVVNISAVKIGTKGTVHEYDKNGNPLKKFPFRIPKDRKATGSGVIIDERGYIITNNHVVRDTKSIKITLSNKNEYDCEIIGADPATDLAVIKIKGKIPKKLPVMEMGNSDKLKVGELVIAIGNPFGFSHTVTTGIISATGRQKIGLADYEYFIQTDAAINPGNSGGALINIKGKLIGINTAIFSKSGGYMGIGFAIPINMVKEVVKELIAKGKVVRGWLGVYIQELDKDIADSFQYKNTRGALVSDVIKDSPAEKWGLKKGDILIAFNGTAIKDVNHIRRLTAAQKPETRVTLTIFRNGKKEKIALVIGTLPDTPKMAAGEKTEKEDYLGLVVENINEELAYKYKVGSSKGVVITRIKNGSAASAAGLLEGDVIKEISRKPVQNENAYLQVLEQVKNKRKILVLFERGGIHKFVVMDTKPE